MGTLVLLVTAPSAHLHGLLYTCECMCNSTGGAQASTLHNKREKLKLKQGSSCWLQTPDA